LLKTTNRTIIGYADFADAALDKKLELNSRVGVINTAEGSLVNRPELE